MNKPARALLGIAILAAGVASLTYMVKTKPQAKRSEYVRDGAAVEIITIEEVSTRVTVRARGTVMPSRQVILGTEVGGKVMEISPELQPGGTFKTGELMARVNPVDYKMAVEQQFALVESAQTQLAVEESRQAVAAREWELFGSKRAESGNKELALRQPQMRSATTQLKSAQSGLKRAKLSVERTLLRAPFDGMVQSRSVELGQIVAPGMGLLSFVGTETYWVQISIPIERLVWISVPGINGKTEGSPVTIHHRTGHEHIQRQGRVLRLLSEVDPAGRMARLLVEVQDPLGLLPSTTSAVSAPGEEAKPATSELPLLLGTYVEVEITGREADKIVEMSRSGLREGDQVYIMTKDDTLEKRAVEVLWRRESTVIISKGLNKGDRVVVSPIAAAIEGMRLRLPGASAAEAAAPETSAGTTPEAKAASTSQSGAEKAQPL